MGRSIKTNHTSRSRSQAKLMFATLAVGCVLVSVLVGWWIQPPVALDEHSYDVTLALYRVCNQRSTEGLEQIETKLLEPEMVAMETGQSRAVLVGVIEKAKRNQWSDAQRDCRRLLEDQVTR